MSQVFEPILPRHLLERFPTICNENDADAIRCPICMEICADALLETACNHTFCRKCFDYLFQRSQNGIINCPQSRNPVNKAQVTPNRAIRETVTRVKVFCVLSDKGCEWKGAYKELETHLRKECLQVKVKCPNFGCEIISVRAEASKHAKECDYALKPCKLCSSYFISNKLAEHESNCLHQVVLCPYGCVKKIMKKDIPQHHEHDCPNAVVLCGFYEFGCDAKLKRHRFEEHMKESSEQHLELMMKKALHYKAEAVALTQTAENLRASSRLDELKATLVEKERKANKLQEDLEEINEINQALVERNYELESTISMLNNADVCCSSESHGSETLDEYVDVEETKKESIKKSTTTNKSESVAASMTESMKKSQMSTDGSSKKTAQKSSKDESVFDIQRKGWLYKKNKLFKKWKKRWMVLTSTVLYTYEQENNYSSALEKIFLKNVDQASEGLQEEGFSSINIRMKNGDVLQLRSTSSDDVIQWILAINIFARRNQ